MKIVKIFLLMIAALISGGINAWQSELSIATGFGHYVLKDDYVSPLRQAGSSAPLEILFKTIREKYITEFSMFYDKSDLNSEISSVYNYNEGYTESYLSGFEYSYLRKILNWDHWNTNLLLGGSFSTFVHFRTHYYTPPIKERFADLISSLNFQGEFSKTISDKHLFYFTLKIPVISYVFGGEYSPKYLTPLYFEEEDSFSPSNNMMIFPRLGSWTNEIGYESVHLSRIGFGASYRFYYYGYDKENKVQFGSHLILLKIKIRFGLNKDD